MRYCTSSQDGLLVYNVDAASIVNLNVPRLIINDSTATALWMWYHQSRPSWTDNPRHVIFVDVEHADMSVAVVASSEAQLTVKGTVYSVVDKTCGSRVWVSTLLITPSSLLNAILIYAPSSFKLTGTYFPSRSLNCVNSIYAHHTKFLFSLTCSYGSC